MSRRFQLLCNLLAGLTVVLSVAAAQAADSAGPTPTRGDQVELFAAIESEQIEVQLVPKDATQATVIIKNKTDRPLKIRMPAAFAGLPVLAQDRQDFGGGRGAGRGLAGGLGGGNAGGANQGFGGGFGGGGMMGGGFFNVGPERIGKLKVATVCLEHGKNDPNPRVPYELRPIESFTQDPALIEICAMLGRGDLNQATAQAAAWHLSDQLSWQELANKIKIKHLNGRVEMFFQPGQIQTAMQAVALATARARQAAPETTSPGELADLP